MQTGVYQQKFWLLNMTAARWMYRCRRYPWILNEELNPLQPFENLLQKVDGDPADIRTLYDEWSADYDRTLADWGYEAPQTAVDYLAGLVDKVAPVLDAGCGTGMVGRHLKAAGFADVVGADFSEESLRVAIKSGCYRQTLGVDLASLPSLFLTGYFGGIICVGVMSYLPNVEATCREFCRIARPGAGIVLTQRTDLFGSRQTQAAFDTLVGEGLWRQIAVTEARPYLPGNPEFDGTGVHYCVFQRL